MQSLRLPKNTKLVAWAHNFHVSKAPMENHGLANTMGTFLSAMLGSKYFVVGLIGWQVSYDQPGFCGTGRPPAPTSLEAKLHALGEDHLLSDPKVESSVLDPGSALPVSGFLIVPQDHYDAFVYLDESPRMTPVGRPPC